MSEQNKKNIDSFKTYAKWVITILFTLSICYKIVTSDLNIDLSGFTFTDLLSLILAIFAIWISINFYHNNNITSNKFYNNTYNFTKDISETLGRIEERFGEKLDSLKDENKSISTRIDKYYSSIPKDEKEEEIEKKNLEKIKDQLQIKNEELNKTIKDLTDKYQITFEDKEKFLQELKDKNEQIKELKRKEVLFSTESEPFHNELEIPFRLIRYGKNKFAKNNFTDLFNSLPVLDKPYIFKFISNQVPKGFLLDLEKFDLIDSEMLLTEKGEKYIKLIT